MTSVTKKVKRQMPKLLTKIYLINWYLFGEQLINIDGHTAILGANGAGKSSLIDAIQTVMLGGDSRFIRYNPGVDERSRRSLLSYTLGVWKEAENSGEIKLRDSCHSYAVLEFKSNTSDAVVTIGLGIEAQWPSKADIKTHFVLKAIPIKREFFIAPDDTPFSPKEFVRQMKQRFESSFIHYDTHESFLNGAMYHLSSNGIKFHPDKFRRNFRNALIFKKIDSVEQFVKEYVLEERPVDAKKLKKSLDVFREIKERSEETEKRINQLKNIENIISEVERHMLASLQNKHIAFTASAKKFSEKISLLQSKVDELNKKWDSYLSEKERLNEDKKFIDIKITKLTINLHSDSKYVKLTELRKDIEHKTDRLRETKGRLHKNISDIKDAFSMADRYLHFKYPETDNYQTIYENAKILQDFVHKEKTKTGEKIAEKSYRLTVLNKDILMLEKQIEGLRNGRVPLPEHYANLRDILNNALKKAGYSDEVIPVCDFITVIDKSWQTAIETYLGDNRFSLVIHPDRFLFCLHIYRQCKESLQVYGAKIVDIEKCLKETKTPLKGSLAEEIAIDHDIDNQIKLSADRLTEIKQGALKYIHLLLGNVIKAETEEDLRLHRRSIMKDCTLFANYSVQRLRPETGLVFGKTGRESYLKSLTNERQDFSERIKTLQWELNNERNTLKVLEDMADRLKGTDSLLADYQQIIIINSEIKETQEKINELEKGSISEIETEIKRLNEISNEIEIKTKRLEADIYGNREVYSNVQKDYTETNLLLKQKEEAISKLNVSHEMKVKASEILNKEINLGMSLDNIETQYFRKAENSEKKRVDSEKKAINELILYASKYEHNITDDMKQNPLLAGQWIRSEIKRLEETELARYKNDSEKAMHEAERIFKEEFIHKLKDNLLNSENQRNELNAILKQYTFHGERYFFQRQPNPKYRHFLNMIMDSENTRIDTPLFSENSDFKARHYKAIEELERLFKMENDINTEKELEEIADYRNYYRYEIATVDNQGIETTLTKRLKTGSGGEIQTPFYVAIASALAYTYKIGEVTDGIRLAVFDEAFNKMDQGNVESAIAFMKDMGLQVILAAPDDKATIFLPHINTAIIIFRQGKNIKLDRIKVKEGISELYESAKSHA